MGKKTLLACLLALMGWAGCVHGQTGVGTAPAAGPTYVPAPRFPLLASLMHILFNPDRGGAGPLLPPQPIVDAVPTREDIARMVADGSFSPAQITAAKIKMDEAQAKFRQAAVRYLASVDCHYYPEAELGLIGALRADRSEAVRLEAAMALGTCHGTTAKMLEALHVCALGLETDGNPSESSERVRAAARTSLDRTTASGMWLDPYASPPPTSLTPMTPTIPDDAVQPAYSYAPTYQPPLPPPVRPPVLPPVSPEERKLAETVGLPSKGVPAPPVVPRSLVEWLQQHNFFRAWAGNGSPSASIDPRLRGLAPLGSETTLAIPVLPNPARANFPPYNNE